MQSTTTKMKRTSTQWVSLFICWSLVMGGRADRSLVAGEYKLPQVLDDRMSLELVAKEPDIVTPIGLTFDDRGRLLVIESHTHFPPDDYEGPQADRIRIVEDNNGDGRADRFRTFLQGTQKTMSLRRGPDGWIYVATRGQVFRTRDTDGDDRADQREVIATLETEETYPHNGLGGLCFDDGDHLYFGLGENLGKRYTLVGKDGTRLQGGGEGGNIYRCRVDGNDLQQVATGFWNPFGICVDSVGRVFTVGNDPDARPPCRLIHVVQGGDYGYQFRYGRSGKHPLQAWDGELPGTLPMVAGTSEAPSSVVPWHGQLYVSSWGEYRIERFTLIPNGASFRAHRQVVLQGDDQFRPIDFTRAPDGSLYFTDWVDRSYNVHGRGRIWRLRWKTPPPEPRVPPLGPVERLAQQATGAPDWDALQSHDPFLHHAAVMGLKDSSFLRADKLAALKHPRQRLGVLEAARRSGLSPRQRRALIQESLQDADAAVRLYAVRWIADERLTEFRRPLDDMLSEDVVSVALLNAILAAIEWLDTQEVARGAIAGESALVAALQDESRPLIQATALKSLPSEHPALEPGFLVQLVRDAGQHPMVRREAGRCLSVSDAPQADELRLATVADSRIPSAIRADVLAGVPPGDDEARSTLQRLLTSPSEVIRQQAERMISSGFPPGNDPSTAPRPDPRDTPAWLEILGSQGNADAGWRIFFGRRSAVRCANCHQLDGRGADVGPDLTGIGRRVDRSRLLQSILRPSQEVSPRYVAWIIQTVAGKGFSAISLSVSNDGKLERFLTAEGSRIDLARENIATRKLSSQSIMPDGMHTQFRLNELRDLLSLLSN